jgi:AcrR family transcriptional regulator
MGEWSETALRIMDAGERLFARHGFDRTSLRMITSEAGVNLAAVNYHFGSKEALIHAIFSRFLDEYVAHLRQDLARMRASGQYPDTRALASMAGQRVLEIKPRHKSDLSTLMQLVGQAFTESREHLRLYLRQRYGDFYTELMDFLREAHPALTARERFWRMQFTLGSVMFVMAALPTLRDMEKLETGERSSLRVIFAELEPFLSAGISASHPDNSAHGHVSTETGH